MKSATRYIKQLLQMLYLRKGLLQKRHIFKNFQKCFDTQIKLYSYFTIQDHTVCSKNSPIQKNSRATKMTAITNGKGSC